MMKNDRSSSQIINQGERHKVGEKSRSSTASEREKTKLRERHRRSITTKIFNGLRKHGSYNLPPRADINDVLRALAAEARWVVEADGTTYRAQDEVTGNQAKSQILQGVPMSSSLTPMCSFAGVGEDNGEGFNHVPPGTINIRDVKRGECSTTVSPRQMGIQASNNSLIFPNTAISSPFTSPATSEVGGQVGGSPFMPTFHGKDDVGAAYLSAESTVETTEQIIRSRNDAVSNNSSMFFDPYGMSVAMSSIMTQMPQNHQALPQECCALNHNTPIASPQRIVHDELEDLSVDEECCFAFIDT